MSGTSPSLPLAGRGGRSPWLWLLAAILCNSLVNFGGLGALDAGATHAYAGIDLRASLWAMPMLLLALRMLGQQPLSVAAQGAALAGIALFATGTLLQPDLAQLALLLLLLPLLGCNMRNGLRYWLLAVLPAALLAGGVYFGSYAWRLERLRSVLGARAENADPTALAASAAMLALLALLALASRRMPDGIRRGFVQFSALWLALSELLALGRSAGLWHMPGHYGPAFLGDVGVQIGVLVLLLYGLMATAAIRHYRDSSTRDT